METFKLDKVILWQDTEALDKELSAYRGAKSNLYSVIQDIEAMGIKISAEILQDICAGEGKLLKESLATLIQDQADKVSLPYLKEQVLKSLPESSTKANEIVIKVSEILKPGYLIQSTLFSWGPYLNLNEQPIIDKHSIYVDNNAKAIVKDMADDLMLMIADFNRYVAEVSDGKVKGFGSATGHKQPLIRVYSDGNKDPDIDGQAFRHIHLSIN